MITVELLSFIKKELFSGKNQEQIKSELLAGGGWSIVDVEEAFNSLNSPAPISSITNSLEIKREVTITTVLKILASLVLGGISGFFYGSGIYSVLGIDIQEKTFNAFSQVFSLISFGLVLVLALFLFYKKKLHMNLWKALLIVVGSGIAFLFAIQTAIRTIGFFESSLIGDFASFTLAGIVGGTLMTLFLLPTLKLKVVPFITLVFISGVIGFSFNYIGVMVPVWQAIMLALIIYFTHRSVGFVNIDQAISNTPSQTINTINIKKRNLLRTFIVIIVIIITIVGISAVLNNTTKNSFLSNFFVQPVNSSKIISNTRSIPAVSENPVELLEILKLDDKRISGNSEPEHAIIKTEDGRFWFFEVKDAGCSDFCVSDGYMIDSQKKTISNLNVQEVVFHIVPMGGSFVTIEDYVSYDKNKKLIYDASEDKVVDEIEDSNETSNFKLLSNSTFSYIKSNFLYIRNILKHEDIKLGRMYRYYSYYGSFEPIFNNSKSVFYVLIYESEQPSNPEHELPIKDDPVKLVEWNIKNNTKRYVSDKSFDFPLTFELIQEGTILLGGGMNPSDSLETLSTYLIDINTGETKEIFKDKSILAEVDKEKKHISIYQYGENNFISGNSGGPHESGMVSVFDFSGEFISKTYFKNDVTYQILQEGTGNFATLGDTVKVRYSVPSYSKEVELKLEPESNASTLEFSSLGMKVGEKRHIIFSENLTTRSNLIYTIPEQRSAEFDLEVISINK